MGVIWVVHEAMKLGFENGHPDWCNLGQGQPEVGDMPGAPERLGAVALEPGDHAYGPIGGTPELREKVAAHLNRLYRQGKSSQYGPDNISIAMGGRLALSRALAAVAPMKVGYQIPDYTAYQDMFELHLSRLEPVCVPALEEHGFRIPPDRMAAAVDEHGLGAFVLSNPCNPTGGTIAGDELAQIVAMARERNMLFLLDEFYSHFIYAKGADGSWGPGEGPVSGAAYIEDVETDPVLLFDGLTKNHRYPGWRVGWIAGPSEMIETINRVGSSLDGGPSRLAQRAALEALEPAIADQETQAVRAEFARKRNVMVERLTKLGVRFATEPESTFYVWGCLDGLPESLRDSMAFFWAALERKVMTVPGPFFDVNPGGLRKGPSPYVNWMRFSFGPPMDNLLLGLDRLEQLVSEA
jgi:aspartate/methionine/tyrosine aminotransferase